MTSVMAYLGSCSLLMIWSLGINAYPLEGVARVKVWKEGMEKKGLHVNMKKTMFMASGFELDVLKDSGKYPCAVCRMDVWGWHLFCALCASTGYTRSVQALKS